MTEELLPHRTIEELVARPHDKVALAEALTVARDIVEDVRARGLAAVRSYVERFDGRAADAQIFFDKSSMRAAWEELAADARSRLERIAERIRVFADAQRHSIHDLEIEVIGGKAGQRIHALERAGCYAPSGTYPLPSTVLMTCITAKAAGVRDVWVATPNPSPIMLAASFVGGANGLLAAGGAHAIAAMAYGAGKLRPCDVVVGPGNRYVTAAKRLVAGDVAIDMAAGPSELVIIADETSHAPLLAADLLGQAEHDADAWPVLLTNSASLAAKVEVALREQLATLPTESVARSALAKGGVCILDNIEDAIALCDQLAPEHVQVCTRNAPKVAQQLSNYGGLFIGHQTPEVLGDYGMGPNHVLPTSGVARSFGGLSVFTFLRVNTWLEATPALDPVLREDVLWLARSEGLEAHARAIERRE